ncbi:MAG: NUDIX domain-containing protein [Candidatus Bathyarchaeia archaeon]
MAFREKSCGAVVFRKNGGVKFLLLHYGAGHWDYVKGQVEPDESEQETVMRELREETSITEARFIEGFREEISYFYRRDGKLVHKQVVFFLVQARSSDVRLSYEHVGYEWLGFEEALKRLTFATAKNILKKANDHLEKQGIK